MDKGVLLIGGITVLVLGVIIAIAMNDPSTKLASSFKGEDAETVSEEGIHWHPKVSIVINGQPQEVPANLGIGGAGGMKPIHTHDTSGELHWEMQYGPIKKGQVKLARFFEQWGKTFNANQILDTKKAEGDKLVMLVNDKEVTAYENYFVKDGDKIEIHFEAKGSS